MHEKIAVVGLGYVGLPLWAGLARHFGEVTGFDIDSRRVAALRAGEDWTGEIARDDLLAAKARLTDKPEEIGTASFCIVTVPTPIDQAKRPDLRPLMGACQTLGEALHRRHNKPKNGHATPLIVFESTVYPGLTEDVCGPRIAEISGLTQGVDFKLGYSPERINPGDRKNRLETITKVISANDGESLDRMADVYGKVTGAGLYRAASIRVAEAAKVLENTQRDLNVALMNELAIICDRIGIRTHDVLAAAGTKWNFLPFTPGLVGGHCIGVDPYYLTWRAEELGYNPQVILAGRRINDNMPIFIAQKIVKLMVNGRSLKAGARVGVLGLAFKENVRDLRNSRVPEIVGELESFGLDVLIHDPLADPERALHEYGLALHPKADLKELDALVVAVPHKELMAGFADWWKALKPGGWVIDVKSVIDRAALPEGLQYWSL
ncbi:MAG TPA: nucleotide sugar dehydrogenase [Alphaproteobacteria bacterium]|nr:nucleotide sugar dehydrogenase [Alphaproteobacteria bacterium]